jgi:GGDEF domain-containing protein
VREELRASDLIGRRGTDSFVVILPDSDEDCARIAAGKLIRSPRGSGARSATER